MDAAGVAGLPKGGAAMGPGESVKVELAGLGAGGSGEQREQAQSPQPSPSSLGGRSPTPTRVRTPGLAEQLRSKEEVAYLSGLRSVGTSPSPLGLSLAAGGTGGKYTMNPPSGRVTPGTAAMTDLGPASLVSADSRRDFEAKVHAHFAQLRGKGFGANDAAALALKIASGVMSEPLCLKHVETCIANATATGCTRELKNMLRGVFGCSDVLCSSFLLDIDREEDVVDGMGGERSEGEPSVSGNGRAENQNPSPWSGASMTPPSAGGVSASLTEDCPAPAEAGKASSAFAAGNAVAAARLKRRQTATALAQAGNVGRHSRREPLGLDYAAISETYLLICEFGDEDVLNTLLLASEHLLDKLIAARGLSRSRAGVQPGFLRQLLVIAENQLLGQHEGHVVLAKLCHAVTTLPIRLQCELVRCLRKYPEARLRTLVNMVQNFITVHLYEGQQIDEVIETATRFLSLLEHANSKSQVLQRHEFYNEAVNDEDFNVKEDYRRWKQPDRYDFSFCKFPFIYDPASKARILQLESTMQMSHEFEDAVLRSIFVGATCPYLVLKVHRDNLVADTLAQIHRRPEDLKKPLKVHFIHEDGVDEGGVQKEFFQLIVRDIFDPMYGMFSVNPETRLFWFSTSAANFGFDMSVEYELIGTLLGLAIYNGHILEFRFPMAMYKKLLDFDLTFADLAEVDPELHRGLSDLLAFDGDVEAVFCQSFQVSVNVFGSVVNVDLKEGGADIPVTNANREEYVELYTRFILDASVGQQFQAFSSAFHRLCGGQTLQLFQPEELEQLICGCPDMDFLALEDNAVYEDGYERDDATVRHFWTIAHELNLEEKKALLFFVTGSDRVPIKGLGTLPFVISKNGTEDHRLPTAHTCYNHLLLPDYSSEDVLRERLMTAIANPQGFGLI